MYSKMYSKTDQIRSLDCATKTPFGLEPTVLKSVTEVQLYTSASACLVKFLL